MSKLALSPACEAVYADYFCNIGPLMNQGAYLLKWEGHMGMEYKYRGEKMKGNSIWKQNCFLYGS